jgi:microcystin-dependent protein
MAIDFPNSPTAGDLYTAGGKTWQWNSTFWAAYGTSPVLRTSDTAPVSPNNGDLWYETDTGRFFTYIDSFWVEIGNADGALQTPTGLINPYAGLTAPTGWLICNGASVSRTTYASLFSVISTTYGVGDGSTTFTLPNLKGRMPVGLDSTQTEFDAMGETGGVKSVTLTEAQMPLHSHTTPAHTHTTPNHTHSVTLGTHAHENYTTANPGSGGTGTRVDYDYDASGAWPYPQNTYNNYTNNSVSINSSGAGTSGSSSGTTGSSSGTSGSTGGTTSVSVLQPFVVVNYIIKV